MSGSTATSGQPTFQADTGNKESKTTRVVVRDASDNLTARAGGSNAGRRRRSLAGKLVRSGLMAAAVSCSIAALAGTAQAAPGPLKPFGPTLGWQLSHPFCANCTAAIGKNQWIDPAGFLPSGMEQQISVKGTIQGKPAAGSTVFLSDRLVGPGAIAAVGRTLLSATPEPFQLNAAGRLLVTYRAADAQPGPIGTDVLTAADNAAGSRAATASYNYDQPAAYVLAPVPVAPPGALAAGQSAPAQLVAIDAAGNVVGGALVADWEDNFCGTWWPGPHPHGPQVGSADNPTYAFTNAAGQFSFTFVSNGSTGGTNVLSVAGATSGQAGPGATTFYQC